MTYGITTFLNSAGDTIIDQDSQNLRVVGKGSVYLSAAGQWANIPLSGVSNPVVFYRWPLQSYLFIGLIDAGGTNVRVAAASGAMTVEYIICGTGGSVPSSDYGILINKADGSMAFCSSYEYARFKDFAGRFFWQYSYQSSTVSFITPQIQTGQGSLNYTLGTDYICMPRSYRRASDDDMIAWSVDTDPTPIWAIAGKRYNISGVSANIRLNTLDDNFFSNVPVAVPVFFCGPPA